MIAYIVHSLLWSITGFVVGWFAGRLGRDVHTLKETVMPEHPRPWYRRRISRDALFGIVIVVLAVLTVASSVLATWQLSAATQCQEQFNNQYRAALEVRSDAAARVRAAQRTFIQAISERPADPQQAALQRQAAISTYLAALDDADRRAGENPIPDVNPCRTR